MADDDEVDAEALATAREARVAARAGSGRRLARSITYLFVLTVVVLYLAALRVTPAASPLRWDLGVLWRSLLRDYTPSAGVVDLAALSLLRGKAALTLHVHLQMY